MRKITKKLGIATVLAAVVAIVAFAQTVLTTPRKVTLSWDYDDNSAEIFKLYHTTNPATPLQLWTYLTNFPGTNRSASINVIPGVNYFTLTASNYWGESDFSNTANTPPAVGHVKNLKVRPN